MQLDPSRLQIQSCKEMVGPGWPTSGPLLWTLQKSFIIFIYTGPYNFWFKESLGRKPLKNKPISKILMGFRGRNEYPNTPFLRTAATTVTWEESGQRLFFAAIVCIHRFWMCQMPWEVTTSKERLTQHLKEHMFDKGCSSSVVRHLMWLCQWLSDFGWWIAASA